GYTARRGHPAQALGLADAALQLGKQRAQGRLTAEGGEDLLANAAGDAVRADDLVDVPRARALPANKGHAPHLLLLAALGVALGGTAGAWPAATAGRPALRGDLVSTERGRRRPLCLLQL